ncbi:DUF4041 domain-containing protein [Flavobacterium acetivorans]|uniref:DUF4041 domain-containing protein n=1 Tax=Flavobacterium acetivorans TaxID=2893883 RepID=UPI001E3A2ACE|nr:DUF4041 domain-containing protein [Flavobacterium sp. F-29]UFH36560.1 DUF4041 domain-containing protein [Flavobacterium sp. F-29]
MGFFDFLKKKEFEEICTLQEKLEKFKTITDIQNEVDNKKNELELLIQNKTNEILEKEKELNKVISDKEIELNSIIENKKLAINYIRKDFDELKLNYETSFETYTRLRKDVSLYESKLDLIEFGIYEPVYEFNKSEDYRTEQNKIIEKQRQLIKQGKAVICETKWTINGSETKGRVSVNRYVKLVLKAFNGECNSLIAKVKWNNVNQMKLRILNSFETLNKLGKSQEIFIQLEFLKLKMNELFLEYEYQAKKQKEKEELREIREELKEEERALREFEREEREAEKEEDKFKIELDKAKKGLGLASGKEFEKLQNKIEKLEIELQNAQVKKERAISMAQQTKRGHVYIISNIGSFGEDVYKIGMTRRLEPSDRVYELGNASVPFKFDIHAMIYSEEARSLENELHKAFEDKKINMLNYRKEFFKVSLDEIENKIKELGFGAEFTKYPEAMQFRETEAILNRINSKEKIKTVEEIIAEEYPNTLN